MVQPLEEKENVWCETPGEIRSYNLTNLQTSVKSSGKKTTDADEN